VEDLCTGEAQSRLSALVVTILLLAEVFPPTKGGSGRWLWELYRRLSDIDVRIIAGETTGAKSFDRSTTLPILRIPLRFSGWGLSHPRSGLQYIRAFMQIRRALLESRPDVIHCGKCLPEGLLAVMIKATWGIPFVTYVHGEELTLAHTSRELTGLTRKVLREASTVIANSHHTKQILVKDWSVPDDRLVVMHPGVDVTRFAPAPMNAAVRARLGWANRRVLLTVGALQRRKGQDMMIRALPAIRARCPDVLYAMVGEGWERAYLDELVAQQGVTDLVQFSSPHGDDDLINCYQQCDVFALPNRQVGWDFEGFGISLLEAQACGKPVIAGASGGTAETIVPGETGYLLSCDTHKQLAEVAANLLDDAAQRSRMGACGRARVVERFDWSVLVEQARRTFDALPHAQE
jgi:phosphatidylinositol alpha-1,6-mannosyltransferase